MIKLVIYKDQLQCPSSKQAYKKKQSCFRCNEKHNKQNPNYKPCVGYKFYCKVKCLFLVYLSLAFEAVKNAYVLETIICSISQIGRASCRERVC